MQAIAWAEPLQPDSGARITWGDNQKQLQSHLDQMRVLIRSKKQCCPPPGVPPCHPDSPLCPLRSPQASPSSTDTITNNLLIEYEQDQTSSPKRRPFLMLQLSWPLTSCFLGFVLRAVRCATVDSRRHWPRKQRWEKLKARRVDAEDCLSIPKLS